MSYEYNVKVYAVKWHCHWYPLFFNIGELVNSIEGMLRHVHTTKLLLHHINQSNSIKAPFAHTRYFVPAAF